MTVLFPFARTFRGRQKRRLPTTVNLSLAMQKALPGLPSHFEWVERQAFGKESHVLLVWLVGCRMPLRWNKAQKTWLDDKGIK